MIDPEAVEFPHISLDSGLFPVGINLTWHGGIHLKKALNQPVQAMTDGVVVAARLPEKDPAKPPYGSRNFVLVKHKSPQGDDFWSLYMHLLPMLIKDDDPALVKAMPWLFDLQLTISGSEGAAVRPHPDTVSASNPPRTSSAGEVFSVLKQRVVRDDDQDGVHCDAEAIKKLINPRLGQPGYVGAMTKELVAAAYGDRATRVRLCSLAYQFQSEWSVDWEKALRKFDPDVAKIQGPMFNLYRFWPDAVSAGCDLPQDGKVYHYHPAAFKLVAYDQPEAAVKEAVNGPAKSSGTPHRTSETGIQMIMHHEGFRSRPYNDAAGHATIGYGTLLHTGSVTSADRAKYAAGITPDEARSLLVSALTRFEAKLNRAVKVHLNQNQFDALMDWVYNLGPGNLKVEICSWLRNLNKGRYDKVPDGLKMWDVAVVDGKKTHMPGLRKRREEEAALFTKTA